MTTVEVPDIDCEQQHPALAVADVAAAVAFYTGRLGFTCAFTFGEPEPTMAGVNLGNVQAFLERGTPAPQGCSLYFVVSQVDALYAFHQAGGVEVVEPIADRPYGLRDYRVRDLDGYVVGFGQQLFTDGPRVPVERVDLTVRLERRLAAVLADLAAAKRMTVGQCLEETLLHTMDGVGPHTPADLRLLARLKAKHGMDYDTHASYRFAEDPGPR